MICPVCGKDQNLMIADNLGQLFKKKNRPSIAPGDSLYAGVSFSGPPLYLVPFICGNKGCGTWFAIYTVPEEDENK